MVETPLPSVNQEDCTGCSLCIETCPEDALQLKDNTVTLVDGVVCEYCGECEAICPTGAISCPYDIIIEQSP